MTASPATDAADRDRPQARIFRQPIAAPSVLGYFSLGSGLILFGTWLARCWIYMAVITWTTAFAALARGPGGFLGRAALGVAAAMAAGGFITGSAGWQRSVAAWRRVILPLGEFRKRANLPGARTLQPI